MAVPLSWLVLASLFGCGCGVMSLCWCEFSVWEPLAWEGLGDQGAGNWAKATAERFSCSHILCC